MSRVDEAISARCTMGEDFFGGWDPDDKAILSRHARGAEPMPGVITDFLGIRTSASLHPSATPLHGAVVGDLPIPDDSLRAETIEYYAVLASLEAAGPNCFSFVELGASYAPWSCVAAVLAERTGRTDYKVVAVEAASYLYNLIRGHLAENGIDADSPRIRLIHGAIAAERGRLRFPKVNTPDENGSQIGSGDSDIDYLGRAVEYEEVEAYPLDQILPDGIVDLIHIDVQGFESIILSSAIDLLDQRVKAIFIGTHSRKIEGELIELFHAHRWRLVRERPTKFSYQGHLADAVGWTTRDGGQYWINQRLG